MRDQKEISISLKMKREYLRSTSGVFLRLPEFPEEYRENMTFTVSLRSVERMLLASFQKLSDCNKVRRTQHRSHSKTSGARDNDAKTIFLHMRETRDEERIIRESGAGVMHHSASAISRERSSKMRTWQRLRI